MANHNDDADGWVDDRLKTLDTPNGFQPNASQARARLRERRDAAGRTARRRVWTLVAVCTVLLAILALPWPRAAAQRLLDRLTLGHIAVIDTARKDLPESVTGAFVMKPQPWREEDVRTLDEAQQIAGFRPALPPSDVLSGTPRLSVVRRATLATAPLKVAEIERALAAAGVRDVTVPKEWEGTTLFAEGGPAVLADYGDIEVIQSLPFRLTTPADFPFGRFMELTFRVFGRPEEEARRLGQQLAENPAIVMHFPGASAVRDVPLRTGRGVLVGNPDGHDGMCFFWSTPSRIYIIEADKLSESRAVAVADSIREARAQP
jgi:hypothetical protein